MPIIRTSSQNLKLRGNSASIAINGAPLPSGKTISLKNQLTEIQSLDDIADVDEDAKVDGAVPVWNSTTNKYEVRTLTLGDSDTDIDGGEF